MCTRIPGAKSRALARQLRGCESHNITFVSDRWPIFWERARGANVWDADGNRYIDLTAAFGVASVGHNNPRVVAAIRRQAAKLLHAMGDVHPNELKLRLAQELVALTFKRWAAADAHVIFANSGAEAVEAALKTAAIHTKRPGVIAFTGGYHGLTYGALDVTWRKHFRGPFTKQLGHFTTHMPFGRLPDVSRMKLARIGAVLVEPIQGRGGIVVPPDDFLPALRAFCDHHGLLLIFDEVYTGFCRTGRWFACEHWNVVPNIICVGKAMSGGFPIAACVGNKKVMDSWPKSEGEAIHTSTFLGNPLGCAASLAAITEMKRSELCVRAEKLGAHLASRLAKLGCVRGKGLMLGLCFGESVYGRARPPGAPKTAFMRGRPGGPSLPVYLAEQLLQRGIIAIPEGDRNEVLGLTPPLTITRRQLDYSIDALVALLNR
jgi:4-aminobutyrate aminotransferase/(S)-3-amino-2-methylpropionate transaminase